MKTVLITGGASGLGEALAWHYAKQGFAMCITDLNPEHGNKMVADITQKNG
jgi:NAD(P)-dependent dehydrogenase (short-subunit alcohol dehydrogenase family)